MSGLLYTRVYNNNFDISYGYISCAIKSKNMDELLMMLMLFVESNQQHHLMVPHNYQGNHRSLMSTKFQQKLTKCRYAKELLRTISSCFETPVWATCCKMNEDVQCVMPNSRRSPNCLIAVVPENNTVDLRYPIFIAEYWAKRIPKEQTRRNSMV